jgi:uncharacterized RDD family membrane protein YckC
LAATTCPHCQAYTYATTGYCQVCRQPLGAVPLTPTAPAPPPTYAQAAGYGATPYAPPPGYAAPPYGAAPYAPPPYGYGYPAVFAAPVYYNPEPVPKRLARSTTGARWGAAALDFFLLLSVWLGLFFIAYPALIPPDAFFVRPILTATIWYSYYAVLDGRGGTLGKRVMGVTLVKEDLSPITPGQGLLRALEILIWPLGVVIILIIQIVLLDESGQGIGDKIAKTYLVRKRDVATYRPSAQSGAPGAF